MATKAQHAPAYEFVPRFLRTLREEAGLTQRELGGRLLKPQSWVHNCEVANRRVDVTELIAWATACGVAPSVAFARFLELTQQGEGPSPSPPSGTGAAP
jgi:transcriptional regulator with XRE-family HTH domain